jgi:hypothetical protein
MVNSLKDVLGLSITLISYDWIASKIFIWIRSNCINLSYRFVLLIFYGYWSHRLSNQFFCGPGSCTIHHSSENLILRVVCANRFQVLSIFFTVLLIQQHYWAFPKVIAITLPIHFILQFWYHQTLKKLVSGKYTCFSIHITIVHRSQSGVYGQNHSQIFILG